MVYNENFEHLDQARKCFERWNLSCDLAPLVDAHDDGDVADNNSGSHELNEKQKMVMIKMENVCYKLADSERVMRGCRPIIALLFNSGLVSFVTKNFEMLGKVNSTL